MENNQNQLYEILFKDTPTFTINRKNGSVKILKENFMPFDIFLEESDDIDIRVNNIAVFDHWCAKRVLSLDRKYAKEIYNFYGFKQSDLDSDKAKIAIQTRCLSLNDCFWLKKVGEAISWAEVNLFQNSLKGSVFEVALLGKSLTLHNEELSIPDLSTKGVAPKAWRREESGFKLLKGDMNDSVTREVEASEILQKIGLPCVAYKKDVFHGQNVASCSIFTSESINLIAMDDFMIWAKNCDYNATWLFNKDYVRMNLADYIVGNNDRHGENWGVLYTDVSNGFKILSLCPLMDFDHAFLGTDLTICQPERLMPWFQGKNITQEDYCLEIIKKHPKLISFDVDLSEFKYGDFAKTRLEKLKSKL